MRLSGKTAVVTAGAGAAGRAICELFAREGAHVAVCDRDPVSAEAYAGELRGLGLSADGFCVDFSRREHLAEACAAIARRLGKIDILVNNENEILLPEERAPLHEMDIVRCGDMIDRGIKSFFTFSKHCMQDMALRKSGSVVNITPVYGLTPVANQTPVVAIASAVVGLTKMWGVELKNEGIRVNAIAAGITDADLEPATGIPDSKKRRLAHLAIQKPVAPGELAEAALFLASDAAGYITGTILPVDGGLSAGYARSF